MFKIVPAPEFTCQVLLSRPDDELPVKLQARFRHKTQRQLDAWFAAVQRKVMEAGATDTDLAVVDAIHEVLVDLGPLADGEGHLVPYSREVLAQLIDNFPAATPELARQYRQRLTDARLGN